MRTESVFVTPTGSTRWSVNTSHSSVRVATTSRGFAPFTTRRPPRSRSVPVAGTYHCFGCGEGGDVFAFIANYEQLDFVEAVQRLADRVGITLTLVEGGTSTRVERGSRSRLIAANKAAAAFYAAQLTTEAAAPARAFLAERGFDDDAAARFGCGYAPAGWDQLFKALTAHRVFRSRS